MLENNKEQTEEEMQEYVEYWMKMDKKCAIDAKIREEENKKGLKPEELKQMREQRQADIEETKKSLARLEAKQARWAEMEANSANQPPKVYKNPNDKPWVDPDFSTIQNPTERKEAEEWFRRWCIK